MANNTTTAITLLSPPPGAPLPGAPPPALACPTPPSLYMVEYDKTNQLAIGLIIVAVGLLLGFLTMAIAVCVLSKRLDRAIAALGNEDSQRTKLLNGKGAEKSHEKPRKSEEEPSTSCGVEEEDGLESE